MERCKAARPALLPRARPVLGPDLGVAWRRHAGWEGGAEMAWYEVADPRRWTAMGWEGERRPIGVDRIRRVHGE
jgi:hypothetical protein